MGWLCTAALGTLAALGGLAADWPSCPAKGCLPCPANAAGRPDCSCENGYTLTGLPSTSAQNLTWDNVSGWLDRCELIRCDLASPLPHSLTVGPIYYGQPLRLLCEPGYSAAGGSLVCEPSGLVHGDVACAPLCGDGILVSVEQCDDGGLEAGDGCNEQCRVEPGFVCLGGSLRGRDACEKAGAHVEGTLTVNITGQRAPDLEELELATVAALAAALGRPHRDVEIFELQNSTWESGTKYHRTRVSMYAAFRVKVAAGDAVGLQQVKGALTVPRVLLPGVTLAYASTSLSDLYVRAVDLEAVGFENNVVPEPFNLRAWLWRLVPVAAYLVCVAAIAPCIQWRWHVRRREWRLMGRYSDLNEQFKGGWNFGICGCLERPLLCTSMLCFLPARMADTWDAVGLMPYWAALRRALCCFGLYLSGCCLCGANVAGRQRSEMRDYFGFGDTVKGNVETADYCCFLCCSVCCVVQEARHVDAALESLPPPARASQTGKPATAKMV